MNPSERAAIAEALNYTEAMTAYRNARRAAGEPDPGSAAAYAAVRAAVAAPASKAGGPRLPSPDSSVTTPPSAKPRPTRRRAKSATC